MKVILENIHNLWNDFIPVSHLLVMAMVFFANEIKMLKRQPRSAEERADQDSAGGGGQSVGVGVDALAASPTQKLGRRRRRSRRRRRRRHRRRRQERRAVDRRAPRPQIASDDRRASPGAPPARDVDRWPVPAVPIGRRPNRRSGAGSSSRRRVSSATNFH